tara:strand:+ start:851 stop:982 length:132 start_codon:yes stop_codon:yes gene_type:complete
MTFDFNPWRKAVRHIERAIEVLFLITVIFGVPWVMWMIGVALV